MKKLTLEQHEQKQTNYIYDLERLLYKIKNARVLTGAEHQQKENIDLEIMSISDKLDQKHYSIFCDMLN